ncbi:MAG: hypothetical protein H7840_01035 [Alphaproteobacteria bacterium]
MRGFMVFALALLLAATTAPAISMAGDVVIAGRSLALVPPPGYCPLSGSGTDTVSRKSSDFRETEPATRAGAPAPKAKAGGRAAIERGIVESPGTVDDAYDVSDLVQTLRRANAGRNEVLMVFADCRDLADRREGRPRALTRHGHYLVPITGGQVRPMVDTDRAGFLAEVEKALPGLDRTGLEEAVVRALARGSTQVTSLRYGVIERDAAAVHIANVGLFPIDGGVTAVAGITTITLANGLLVATNLYRPFDGDGSLDALLGEQRAIARRIVQDNPTQVEVPTVLSPEAREASHRRAVALTAILLAAVVGVGSVMFGWSKSH